MEDYRRAALYARVSSEQQAAELTIGSQVAVLRARIRADGLSLDKELCFLDEGCSGTTLVRPALERLRDLAYCGAVDRLYVHSPDRLARQYAYQFVLLEEFRKHQVEVVFLNDIAPTDSPEGHLLVQMQGMIAEFERAKILERTRRGRRFAAQQGKVSALAHAPFGYRYVSKHEAGGAARYEVIPEQAELVREMFAWVALEGLSLAEVCRRLYERGVPTATGRPRWDTATVRGILSNPAYGGTAKFGKTRLVPRHEQRRPRRGDPATPRYDKVTRPTADHEQESIPVPALVSAELIAATAEQLAENRRRYRAHKQGAEFLLSGLLVCGRCGSAYCGRRHRPDGKKPYVTIAVSARTLIATAASRRAPTPALTADWKKWCGQIWRGCCKSHSVCGRNSNDACSGRHRTLRIAVAYRKPSGTASVGWRVCSMPTRTAG